MSHVRIAVAACLSVTLAGGILLAQGKGAKAPVTIEVVGTKPDVVSFQTAGAWPLTIRMKANAPLGIATYVIPYSYPLDSQQAYVVFDDPDGCFSLTLFTEPGGVSPCANYRDETYLEFTPTVNLPDLVKYRVDTVRAERLGAAPQLLSWTAATGNTLLRSVGPDAGPSIGKPCNDNDADGDDNVGCDNYGYGRSPNLPGLVILSDTGVGLVSDTNFNLAQPKMARNLAGLINSVTWTMNDCLARDGCASGATVVTAHMNVPRGLFTPLVRVDYNNPVNNQWTNVAYQIDGSSVVYGSSLEALRTVLENRVTTLRVFVVNRDAPSKLPDWNGNGVVDAQDAVGLGYTLLSAETLVRFRTYNQEVAAGLGIWYDFGAPVGMLPPPAPGGSGGIRDIPR